MAIKWKLKYHNGDLWKNVDEEREIWIPLSKDEMINMICCFIDEGNKDEIFIIRKDN